MSELYLSEAHIIWKRLQAYKKGPFPKDDVARALELQEEVTPLLLKEMDDALANPNQDWETFSWLAFNVALFLLSKFKEPRAFQKLLAICKLSEETIDELLGDGVTEDLHKFLASTFDGDLTSLRRIVSDNSVEEYVRSAALNAQIILYCHDIIARDELLSYLRFLFIELKDEHSAVHDNLPLVCAMIHATELRDFIEMAFRDNKIDRAFIDMAYVDKKFKRSEENALDTLKKDKYYHFIEDPIDEMQWWSCFKEDIHYFEDEDFDFFDRLFEEEIELVPYARSEPKIGRNAACLCGSGKKYKKCCLNRSDALNI